MLLKFTVKAPKGSKNIESLNAKLTDKTKLMKVVGNGFAKHLREHFRGLNKRPNKRAWRKLGFWSQVAKSVSFVDSNENSATVSVQDRRFRAKVFGARITPKAGKKFLAIPAIESRYGISPSSLDKNDLTFRKTRKGGLLGEIRSDGSMEVHYYLVRSAKTPKEPNALPTTQAIQANTKLIISKYLKH